MTSPPPIRCLILDFDGTFTDVGREAVPFLAAYREGLGELIGQPIDALWEESVAEVQSNPDAHGFEYDGVIVAPSHADPYILAASVARLVSKRHPITDENISALFRKSYAKADIVFRPDAREVIETLLGLDLPVFVVSNSETVHVRAKLEYMNPTGLERLEVRGGARKFELTTPQTDEGERFAAIPETLSVPGLDRPIYLRRGKYFEVLSDIWEATRTTPEQTFVCGDIFELDLALPSQLGAQTHLVTRSTTPAWERNAARSVPHGGASDAFSGVMGRIMGQGSRGG